MSVYFYLSSLLEAQKKLNKIGNLNCVKIDLPNEKQIMLKNEK